MAPELPPFLKADRVVLDPPLPPRRSPFKKGLLALLLVGISALTGLALLGVDPTVPNPSVPVKGEKR